MVLQYVVFANKCCIPAQGTVRLHSVFFAGDACLLTGAMAGQLCCCTASVWLSAGLWAISQPSPQHLWQGTVAWACLQNCFAPVGAVLVVVVCRCFRHLQGGLLHTLTWVWPGAVLAWPVAWQISAECAVGLMWAVWSTLYGALL